MMHSSTTEWRQQGLIDRWSMPMAQEKAQTAKDSTDNPYSTLWRCKGWGVLGREYRRCWIII